MAHADLGLALLSARDLAGAERHFEAAAEKGPNWADGLKLWGDALALQGQDEEAERKYRAAAQLAPRWGALHIAWGKTLWRTGEAEQARETFRAAQSMDLSPVDQARLRRIRAAAGARG
jgi:Tfp pilus assembly protein PilF